MKSVEERFWKFVRILPDCWEWTGYKDHRGYGRMNVGTGIPELAHRVSLKIQGIKVPNSMCVLHSCDNPSCVKPAHLRIGTKAENNAEMRLKKRSARGQKNGMAKLTNAEAVAIKRALDRGIAGSKLAVWYNISPATVSSIKHGTRWIYLSEMV